MTTLSAAFCLEELDRQHHAALPPRDLLIALTLLGLLLFGVSDVAANVNTSGPNSLFGSLA